MILADLPPHLRAVAAAQLAPVPALPPVSDADRDAAARVEVKAERDLQRRIHDYLTQHRTAGTVRGVIWPPTHQRSQLPLGWPDLTFCYRGRPIAMEVKMPGGKPEPHQAAMHERMRADGWHVVVVHSLSDVSETLNAVDALA